jgi:hypothetical protein
MSNQLVSLAIFTFGGNQILITLKELQNYNMKTIFIFRQVIVPPWVIYFRYGHKLRGQKRVGGEKWQALMFKLFKNQFAEGGWFRRLCLYLSYQLHPLPSTSF